MRTYVFPVELEQDEDGRWAASIPLLPGCSAWGHTKEEALQNLREAAQAYLEVLLEQQGSLPPEVEKEAILLPDSSVAVTV